VPPSGYGSIHLRARHVVVSDSSIWHAFVDGGTEGAAMAQEEKGGSRERPGADARACRLFMRTVRLTPRRAIVSGSSSLARPRDRSSRPVVRQGLGRGVRPPPHGQRIRRASLRPTSRRSVPALDGRCKSACAVGTLSPCRGEAIPPAGGFGAPDERGAIGCSGPNHSASSADSPRMIWE
jgi:hypothetical protein